MPPPTARLLHPAYLAALAVLLVNDHVLNAAVPGAVTGKLSDLAGLVVLPVLLCVLAGVRTRGAAWVVHLGVGGLFAAVQFVPSEALVQATGLRFRHTADPTDLAALAVLPLGVRLALAEPARARWVGARRALAPAVVGLAAVAVVATAPPPRTALVRQTPIIEAADRSAALAVLESRLRALGAEAVRTDTLSVRGRALRSAFPSLAVYEVAVRDPLRPDVVVRADLFAEWDPETQRLSATIYEPWSVYTGAAERPEEDGREVLLRHLIRPLQDAGIKAEAADR